MTAVPDQAGRVVLVTGASSGIGKETARRLAGAGATVVVSGRDPVRLGSAVDDLRASTGHQDVHALEMDVSSLASVRAGAARLLRDWSRLDVLINNAGVILSSRQESVDGWEMTFATNHLGHFLLTTLLLDRMGSHAGARVVNVSSVAHRGARHMGFDDLQSQKSYSAVGIYNRTKLANLLFTRELAKRVAGTGVSALAVHPGAVRSGWGQGGDTAGGLGILLKLARPFEVSPRMGAAASVYAATAPGLEARNGAYFQRLVVGSYGPVRQAQPSALAQDDAGAAHLWALSEEMIEASPPPGHPA